MKLPLTLLVMAMLSGCSRDPQSYVDRGNKYFDSGKYLDAALQYQKAIQKSPDFGEAHYRMGLLDLKRSMLIPAYQELQRAVQLMPGNASAAARFAELSLVIYNSDPRHPAPLLDQALRGAQKLVAKDPASFDGNSLSGALALVQSHFDAAVNFYRKAVQAKPDDMNARLALARALARNRQPEAAEELARQMIAKDKTFGGSYDFLAETYAAANKLDDVEKVLRLKAANNPKQPLPVLELARFFAMAKNPAAVDSTLQTLTGNQSTFPDARLLAGDFNLKVGRPDQAVQEYQAGLREDPKQSDAYHKRLSHIWSTRRNFDAAEQELEAILKTKPADDDAKMMRALVWMDQGKPEKLDPAIAEFRAQLPKHPQDPILPFQIGNALARKSDIEGARSQWTAAARLNPIFLPARYSLTQLYLDQGNTDAALRTAEEILAITPKDPGAQLLHISCLTTAGRFQMARSELNGLATQYPNSADVRFRLGMLALAEHKNKDAETIFRELRQLPGTQASPQVDAGLAQAMAGEDRAPAAIQMLQEEVAKNPGSPLLRQTLARLAAGSGNYDLVIEQYRQMIAAAPSARTLQFSLAEAYAAKGDLNTAISILKRAADSDPKNIPGALELIQIYMAAGRGGEAKALCAKVLEKQPHDANALNDMAYVMAETGDNLDQALNYAKQSLQFAGDPNLKNSVSDTMGWIYLKKKMYNEALLTFRSLVSKQPADATYRYHLGVTLYETGDKQRAREELEAALAAKPPSPDQDKIKQLLSQL